MKIWITGVAGALGSALAKLFLDMGMDVAGNDVTRVDEAWRLEALGIVDRVRYIWKSSWDLSAEDIDGYDVVVDAAIEFADRPAGIASPRHVASGNLWPALSLLEAARRASRRPVLIYPSSFNALYGHRVISEDTPVAPTSLYGWTKAAAELLYRAYHISYGIPVIITRVGSAYSPYGRLDELSQRLVLYALKGREFRLRSPEARRLWTYYKDVLSFYRRLIEKLDEAVGLTLHCAGNKGDEIVSNRELAELVRRLTGSDFRVIEGEYEPGEVIGGRPINFAIEGRFTREFLKWEPSYTLEEGFREHIEEMRKLYL